MATISAAAGGTDATSAGMQYRLTPEKYTTIDQLLDPVKDMVLPHHMEKEC